MWPRSESHLRNDFSAPRMHGEHYRLIDRVESVKNRAESFRIVRVFAPMYRGQEIALFLYSKSLEDLRLPCAGPILCPIDHIQHHVADLMNIFSDAFRCQILNSSITRAKQKTGQMIRNDAVDFLGHPAVEAPQSGFDMRDSNR